MIRRNLLAPHGVPARAAFTLGLGLVAAVIVASAATAVEHASGAAASFGGVNGRIAVDNSTSDQLSLVTPGATLTAQVNAVPFSKSAALSATKDAATRKRGIITSPYT